MEENPITPEQAAEQVYAVAANMMVRQNKGPYEVQQKLITMGLDEKSARIVVENLERQIEEAKKGKAKKDMLYGGLWFFGGLIVTVVSLSAASNSGSYVVAWGAIIFGGIQFFRGISNS